MIGSQFFRGQAHQLVHRAWTAFGPVLEVTVDNVADAKQRLVERSTTSQASLECPLGVTWHFEIH